MDVKQIDSRTVKIFRNGEPFTNLKPGDLLHVWWATGTTDEQGRNVGEVLALLPYHGLYPEWFTHTAQIASSNAKRGWVEMTVKVEPLCRYCREGLVFNGKHESWCGSSDCPLPNQTEEVLP